MASGVKVNRRYRSISSVIGNFLVKVVGVFHEKNLNSNKGKF